MADLVRIQGVHGCFSGSHAFPDMEAASIRVIPKSALNPRFFIHPSLLAASRSTLNFAHH
jgi:hypothetical protein